MQAFWWQLRRLGGTGDVFFTTQTTAESIADKASQKGTMWLDYWTGGYFKPYAVYSRNGRTIL